MAREGCDNSLYLREKAFMTLFCMVSMLLRLGTSLLRSPLLGRPLLVGVFRGSPNDEEQGGSNEGDKGDSNEGF